MCKTASSFPFLSSAEKKRLRRQNEAPDEREKRQCRERMYKRRQRAKELEALQAEGLDKEKPEVQEILKKIEERRFVNKLYKREQRDIGNEIPDKRLKRLERQRVYVKQKRLMETDEQVKLRRLKDRIRVKLWRQRQQDVPEDKLQRLEKNREYMRQKRKRKNENREKRLRKQVRRKEAEIKNQAELTQVQDQSNKLQCQQEDVQQVEDRTCEVRECAKDGSSSAMSEAKDVEHEGVLSFKDVTL